MVPAGVSVGEGIVDNSFSVATTVGALEAQVAPDNTESTDGEVMSIEPS